VAARAKAKKKSTKGRSASGGAVGSRGRVAKTASPGKGHNSGGPSDELYQRHWAKIETTAKAVEKAKEAYDQAKGVHQSAYKTAKSDGCDTDAIRALRKLHKQDQGVVTMLYSNIARVARIVGSPYGPDQLDLFSGMEEPGEVVDVALQGLNAGKNAEPVDNCPYPPGSDNYVMWRDNWEKGQEQVREGLRS